jgi:ABC-2 type transport system ATP-binding protein
MAELAARVVEIGGNDLRAIKNRVMQLPEVQSAAQQGLHLRVLLNPGIEAPVDYLKAALADAGLNYTLARPSLEDVFVAATQGSTAR